ncbi:hypothetical protein DO65_6121 [Burkholderia pseudomallei]|nr:hypothetical protein DO65_6121 [Burkholderia pseudomallei]
MQQLPPDRGQCFSFAPCGASYSARAYASSAGAGNARRSSLPFGVSGHASSRTYADGTM